MVITDIVFDFDGTCTQIPFIHESYLDRYLKELNKRIFTQKPISHDVWHDAQKKVIENSPKAAWTISSTPTAPAAADPYILAYESSKLILRQRKSEVGINDPPFEIHRDSNEANQAPWRSEAREVFERLIKNNINIYFISNSSSTKITQRLRDLLGVADLPKGIKVQSDASKFSICELVWDSKESSVIPEEVKMRFENIPPTYSTLNIGRPVYLRRGYYFEAICKSFNNDLSRLGTTVFCGDIWEMDLAMPYELGANIHLIEREAPFNTYDYERKMISSFGNRAKISKDLNDILNWL